MAKFPMRTFSTGDKNKTRAFEVCDQLANLSRHMKKIATIDSFLPASIPVAQFLFITGTDTGVGKTVFASLLTRHLLAQGIHVAALKPVCSGNRDDARKLRAAAGNVLSLDEVNPWHFRAPLAPLLAARRERKKVRLVQVVKHIRSVAAASNLVIVEGAGGLLSPLGEDFDSRDLILALKAMPVIVAPNRLGVVNQVLLTLEALPGPVAQKADVVLVNPPRADLASRTNPALLEKYVSGKRLIVMPWFGRRLK